MRSKRWLTLALAAAELLHLLLVLAAGSVRGALGAAFLRAVRFTFLRSALSSIVFVFAIRYPYLSWSVDCGLEPLKLGEFLHQLFHSEL